MPVIDPGNEILNESSCEYWQNELMNLRILLNEIDKGILTILQTGIESYKIDTGQSSQSTTRHSIFQLKEMRTTLMSQIDDLESKLGLGCFPSIVQVRPYW